MILIVPKDLFKIHSEWLVLQFSATYCQNGYKKIITADKKNLNLLNQEI